MALVNDTFNRADQNPPGTSDSGHLWVDKNGDWAVRTNQLACLNSVGTLVAVCVIESLPTDFDMQADLTVIPTFEGYAVGLTFRFTDNNNWWRLVVTRLGDLVLQKNVGGTISTVGGPVAVGTTACTLRVVAEAATIKGYRDGTLHFTVTDSHNQTASSHGSSISIGAGGGDTGRLDNFLLDPLAVMNLGRLVMA